MAASTNVVVSNLELTPQRVKWNGVDIGGTTGNVQVEWKYQKGEIKADQLGTSVLDRRITGFEAKVTTEIAEIRDIDAWAVMFPSATVVTSGGDTAIKFNLPIGHSDRDNARQLNLHPIVAGDADVANEHTFYLAYPSEESEITYSPGEQAKAKIVWNVYPVLTGTEGQWYQFGDPTV